ncbi:MAG TPA: ethanolamine ammonia-lyase subunit EutB [Kofleriaceae bacterium]|nr:ethanolamine ammonia-lyase subunit EutB [Kofleriaceae bacterium]
MASPAELRPLAEIHVPAPRPDVDYPFRGLGRSITFRGLPSLLGAADLHKAGDARAGLAAPDEPTREAARTMLAQLTLQHLHDHPLTDAAGRVDDVMRVNYDIDRDAFAAIAAMTVGELHDHLLRAPGDEIARTGRALTGVMAAAVAKLCDVHELVYIARKISRPTRARTLLGAPGTLSSRIQPNHPSDDPRGITLLTLWGLSIGSGDAIFGVNPAIDTVDHVAALLGHLDQLRRRLEVPTQICVLAHVRTQLAALEAGAPVEILFQSLAGTEATLVSEFDCTIELLDAAYRTMAERGALAGEAAQFTYFETGQGSELTYGKHDGIDMTTLEALCYGLARRWDPFMVNNVTGFIGPETHQDDREMVVSNLQDHFMGKLLGLPMGMAPCFTLHAGTSLEGQQMATALLAAAGANYYMDVPLGADRMLAYFDTSGHDVQTLRELHGRRPGAEYLRWAISRGIFEEREGQLLRGPRFGDVRALCASDAELAELWRATPIAPGFGVAGPRPESRVSRQVRLHQAVAREAAASELSADALASTGAFRLVATQARTRAEHLGSPHRGAQLAAESAAALAPEPHPVAILVSDGLSAEAVHKNVPELLPVLVDGLTAHAITAGAPLLARHGRVKLAEAVAERLGARVVVHLIGERPGGDAASSRSLSAYLCLRTNAAAGAAAREPDRLPFEYTVISNIYAEGGLPPAEAAAVIVEKVVQILAHDAAGNRLEARLATANTSNA